MEKELITGPRGGQYYVNDKGKKVYIKSPKKKTRRSAKTPKLCKYTFKINVYKDGELVDDWNEWCNDFSKESALENIKSRGGYYDSKYEFILLNIENLN